MDTEGTEDTIATDLEDRGTSPTGRTVEDRRLGGALLVIVVVLVALLAFTYGHVDVDSIADEGWQDNALWATAVGAILLGIALATLAWSLASPVVDSLMVRTAVVAAVAGVIMAVVVLGVADVQGGERARSSVGPVSVGGSGGATTAEGEPVVAEDPIALADALEPDNLTSAAFPVGVRTFVQLELTPAGRELIAGAQGCAPRDLANNEVLGTIVGGTWVQPLVIVGPPVREDGSLVARCHRIATRLPPTAGFALPQL